MIRFILMLTSKNLKLNSPSAFNQPLTLVPSQLLHLSMQKDISSPSMRILIRSLTIALAFDLILYYLVFMACFFSVVKLAPLRGKLQQGRLRGTDGPLTRN